MNQRDWWMRNSAVDNPQFLATTIGNFLVGRIRRQEELRGGASARAR